MNRDEMYIEIELIEGDESKLLEKAYNVEECLAAIGAFVREYMPDSNFLKFYVDKKAKPEVEFFNIHLFMITDDVLIMRLDDEEKGVLIEFKGTEYMLHLKGISYIDLVLPIEKEWRDV